MRLRIVNSTTIQSGRNGCFFIGLLTLVRSFKRGFFIGAGLTGPVAYLAEKMGAGFDSRLTFVAAKAARTIRYLPGLRLQAAVPNVPTQKKRPHAVTRHNVEAWLSAEVPIKEMPRREGGAVEALESSPRGTG
jgi:hypothetical protein